MLKSGGSILDANPGSDLDAIQQTDNNYRLNGTGSGSSVRTNVGSGNNALSALGYRLATLSVKGSK